jgi:hypothetical protein
LDKWQWRDLGTLLEARWAADTHGSVSVHFAVL